VSSESLISLAEFVLKNNYFEFNSGVYSKNSGTAMHMGTKFAPAYACIFMAMVETEFLEQQVTSLFVNLPIAINIYIMSHNNIVYIELNDISYIVRVCACIKKICSREEDFEKHLQELSSWLKIEHIQHGS
jgi:hypothetical protein